MINLATHEWSLLGETIPRPYGCGRTYLVGYGEDDLYFVEHDDRNVGYCHVDRFDWLERAWKKIGSLEGGVIFLNRYRDSPWYAFGMSGEELSEQQTDLLTKMAANMVYYFSNELAKITVNMCYYSVQCFNMRFYVYGQQKNGDRENRVMG